MIELPCNVSPPSSGDSVVLILWYKDESGHPVYYIDARNSDGIPNAEHSSSSDRVSLELTPLSAILRINPVIESDSGGYRCRVDFKRGRTINRVFKLNVIGKQIEQ